MDADRSREFAAALTDLVRELRADRGWSRRQLAERTGGSVNEATLRSFESGEDTMTIADAWHLATALGVSLSVLTRAAEQCAEEPWAP